MPNIEKYHSRLPAISKLDLVKVFVKEASDNDDLLELSISIQQEQVNIKELSSYLDFIYRIDASLSKMGRNRYVHTPKAQIEISEIRFGSWIIVIQRLLGTFDADILVIIYLALRYLPKLIPATLDGVFRYYQAMEQREDFLKKKHERLEKYEEKPINHDQSEKADRRKNRKNIRELLSQEPNLEGISKKQKEKLVDLLEEIFRTSGKSGVPASRMAQKFVKDLRLGTKKK